MHKDLNPNSISKKNRQQYQVILRLLTPFNNAYHVNLWCHQVTNLVNGYRIDEKIFHLVKLRAHCQEFHCPVPSSLFFLG